MEIIKEEWRPQSLGSQNRPSIQTSLNEYQQDTKRTDSHASKAEQHTDKDRVHELNINDMQSNLQFFRHVKERMHVRDDCKSQERFAFYKKYVVPSRHVCILVYILVVPVIECPDWCIDRYDKEIADGTGEAFHFSLPCASYGVPYSSLPTLSPVYTCIIDIFCVLFFAFCRWYKMRWQVQRRQEKIFNTVMLVVFFMMQVDIGIAILQKRRAYFNGMMRPIIVGCFMQSVRKNAKHQLQDLYDSSVYLLVIFLFVFAYANVGHYVFASQYEGYQYFSTLSQSLYSMQILLTTANFPDVMLPAYNDNFFFCFFFISFLVIGFFYLLPILLASIYEKFKARLEQQSLEKMAQKEQNLTEYVDRFDKDHSGSLNEQELLQFLSEAFDLQTEKSQQDQNTYQFLVQDLRTENETLVSKQRIIQYFLLESGYNKFIQFQQEARKHRKRKQLEQITDIGLPSSQTLTSNMDQPLVQQEEDSNALLRVGSATSSAADSQGRAPSWRVRYSEYLRDPFYNAFLDLILVGVILVVVVFEAKLVPTSDPSPQYIFSLSANTVFLIDMVANFVVLGCKGVWICRIGIFFELFLQICSIIIVTCQFKVELDGDYVPIYFDLYSVFVLRTFRLTRYLREIKDVEFIFVTSYYLTKPILNKLFFIYLFFYEYSYLGQLLYGGVITMEVYEKQLSGYGAFYFLLNFNDYASSMVVLFQQMIINNWWVVVNMISDVTGHHSRVFLFFFFFWIHVVLILLNIMVAIVLEIYGSLNSIIDDRFDHIKTQKHLWRELREDDEVSLQQKLAQAQAYIEQLETQLSTEQPRLSISEAGLRRTNFDYLRSYDQVRESDWQNSRSEYSRLSKAGRKHYSQRIQDLQDM